MTTAITEKYLRVSMPDGSKWDVPAILVAKNRAEHYKGEFDGSLEKSLAEDTIPLFEEDDYEIEDWAVNNMDWSDVSSEAFLVEDPEVADFEDGWSNGDKEIINY